MNPDKEVLWTGRIITWGAVIAIAVTLFSQQAHIRWLEEQYEHMAAEAAYKSDFIEYLYTNDLVLPMAESE